GDRRCQKWRTRGHDWCLRTCQARTGDPREDESANRAGKRGRGRRQVAGALAAAMSNIAEEQPERYWFARHSKSIIFLICILTAAGIYLARTIPVAVFPTTNFPRIIVGVDNSVMPI